MKSVETYQATIYLGLTEGYGKVTHTSCEVKALCQEYCNRVGLCITLTELDFIYKGGCEFGAAIGFINYPRFPSTPEDIKANALALAKELKQKMGQIRVSVVCSDETIMLGEK